MDTFQQAAFSLAGAGQEALAFGRHMIRITADQTGGALGCFEAEVPPAKAPRPMSTRRRTSSSTSPRAASPSGARAPGSS